MPFIIGAFFVATLSIAVVGVGPSSNPVKYDQVDKRNKSVQRHTPFKAL